MKSFAIRVSCVFLLAAFFVPQWADAASLYIDPARSSLNRGDTMALALRLDTDEAAGECVNAVDGVVTYSSNIDPVDISIGSSIFSIWVEQPVIDRENRRITFAGGIPNGYCGRVVGDPRLTNVIAEIIVRSPGFAVGSANDESFAVVEFTDESTAYLNDGRGTKAPLTTYGARIELSKQAGTEILNPWQERVQADRQPPEEFSILLQRDDLTFAGKYYIVFNTTDKQTGISHYEVMEEPSSQFSSFDWGRADAPWVRARSPYVLKDQSLNSTIRVRAIDKAGNQYVATLVPDESVRAIPTERIIFFVFIAFLGLIIVLVLLTFFAWYRRVRRRKSAQAQNETEERDGEESPSNDYEDTP